MVGPVRCFLDGRGFLIMSAFSQLVEKDLAYAESDVGETLLAFGSSFIFTPAPEQSSPDMQEVGTQAGAEVQAVIRSRILGTNVMAPGVSGTYAGKTYRVIEVDTAPGGFVTQFVMRR